MAKIKVFKFEVVNAVYSFTRKEVSNSAYYDKCIDKLVTTQQIEDTINTFLEDKELISMNINTVDVHYHNNGYDNTIEMYYTLIYNDK